MNKFFIIAILLAGFLGLTTLSQAQGLPSVPSLGQKLIGGQIQTVTLCCNGVKIKVGQPNSGDFLYVPGRSTLYPFYNIFTPGVWVLGTASGLITTCQKIASFPPCSRTELLDGTIDIIGTSAL